MKKYLLFIFIIFVSIQADAQQNVVLDITGIGADKTDLIDKHVVYTDDSGVIIKITSNGSAMNGNINKCHSTIYSQNLFRKYDATGTVIEWERCYPPLDTQADFIFPVGNGEFYSIGFYPEIGTNNEKKYFIAKEHPSRDIQWIKAYGGASNLFLRTACRLEDGGFVLGFESFNTGGDITTHYGGWGLPDMWFLKVDSNGNKVWARTIGGTVGESPTRVLPATGGQCYVTGVTSSDDYDCTGNNGPAGYPDGYIAKLDDTGGIIWSKCIGGSDSDGPADACANGSGGVLMAGSASSTDGYVYNHLSPVGVSEAWLVNIDSNGNVIWADCYGASGGVANVICKSSDNTIWTAGVSGMLGRHTVAVYSSDGDAWTARIDNNGTFISSKVIGSGKVEEGKMICALSNGIVMIAGEYLGLTAPMSEFPTTYYDTSVFKNQDIFLARLAPWTTSVNESGKSRIPFTVYPNPAQGKIILKLDRSPKESYQVTISANDGKVVYAGTVERKSITINTEDWASGTYIISLTGENGYIGSVKVQVQH